MAQLTTKTRNSLHLWLEQLAHEANNNGLTLQDMVKVVKKLEIRPTKDNLKETFVKPYILAAYGLDSTEKMNSQQINETYDALNKLFSYHWHIHMPWPSEETLIDKYNL
jgi:hypothetical protein